MTAAKIEVWEARGPGAWGRRKNMTLLVTDGEPMLLLSHEDLGSTDDDSAAAEDLVDFCGGDLRIAHYSARNDRGMRWVAQWRKQRVLDGKLRGECAAPRCADLAIARSPDGLYCDDEACWPGGVDHV